MKSENAKGVGLRNNDFASQYYEHAWSQIALYRRKEKS